MEAILPGMDKVIGEPGSVHLWSGSLPAGQAVPGAVSAEKKDESGKKEASP
jgi:hypothetical protein